MVTYSCCHPRTLEIFCNIKNGAVGQNMSYVNHSVSCRRKHGLIYSILENDEKRASSLNDAFL